VQFQGQTKSKLNNPEVLPLVENVARGLEQLLNERPTAAAAIVNRILLACKARQASREASEGVRRKIGISHRLTLPGKLADCSSTKPQDCELFLVEGDSAGGSAKQARDRHFQAVLPLRGKVLNAIAASTKKISDNKELANIVAALGAGAAEAFRNEKLRYGKIIILTDADADGMHIATLLMAFFFQHMRKLIAGGNLYLGKPPLYGIYPTKGPSKSQSSGQAGQKGSKAKGAKAKNEVIWAYSDEELRQEIARHKLNNPRVVRFKGLGEMNPDTLWETTLNPKSRTLLRVSIPDEKLVMEALQGLMGSDSSYRSRLIQENAARIEVDV
jgi:DNA gyrase subunit B/topoisomerase-4 subunit B